MRLREDPTLQEIAWACVGFAFAVVVLLAPILFFLAGAYGVAKCG